MSKRLPTGSQPPWGNAPSNWSDPYGAGAPGLSLGQIVDSIYSLPEEQRSRLYILLGVAPIGTQQPAMAGPTPQIGVAGPGPRTEATRVSGGITPDHQHTVDPKTGKVFKLVPKKERSDEYTRLEQAVKDSIAALKAFSDANSIGPQGENSETLSASADKEYKSLLRGYSVSKEALKQYKTAHPGDFQGPKPKGKGKSGKQT